MEIVKPDLQQAKRFVLARWIALIAVIILLILWYKSCHPANVAIPAVITVAEQKQQIRIDSIASQKYKDSVGDIIYSLQLRLKQSEQDRNTDSIYAAALEVGMTDLLSQTVPDTCKEAQAKLATQYYKILQSQQQKDNSCNNTISTLKKLVEQKDIVIKKGVDDNKKLRINLDTCFSQQSKLQSALKKTKPKREIYAGIMAMGNPSEFLKGYGVNLGLRNKKGTMYEVGAIQLGSTISYTVGIKTTLFKF